MKKFMRFISLLALIALTVSGSALTASAQGSGQVNCNGLSEADCQILNDSMAAAQTIRSFTMPAWSLNFALDAGPTNTFKFEANGSGTVVLPDVAMALVSDLPSQAGPTDMGPIVALLQKIDAAMVEQAIAQTGLELVIDQASLQAPGQSMAGSADLILKDSALYVQLESPSGVKQWFGDKIELTDANRADLAKSINDLITQVQSEEFQAALAQSSELQGATQEIYAVMGKYITTVRGADAGGMHVFTTTFDLKGLLNDPDLPAIVMKYLKNPAVASALSIKPGDVEGLNDTQVKFVMMTAGLLFKDSSFTMEQWIGADDKFLHKYALNMALTLDTSLFGNSASVGNVALNAGFSVEMDQINTATMDGVTVPSTYKSMNSTSDFLPGDASMIQAELQPGQTFSGAFTGTNNQQDIYSLKLDAGKAVSIEIKAGDAPTLKIYGPDGFLAGDYDMYNHPSQTFTADTSGLYLIVVEASWEMKYDITVRPQ